VRVPWSSSSPWCTSSMRATWSSSLFGLQVPWGKNRKTPSSLADGWRSFVPFGPRLSPRRVKLLQRLQERCAEAWLMPGGCQHRGAAPGKHTTSAQVIPGTTRASIYRRSVCPGDANQVPPNARLANCPGHVVCMPVLFPSDLRAGFGTVEFDDDVHFGGIFGRSPGPGVWTRLTPGKRSPVVVVHS
jgi:hypothetical protein